MKAHALGLSLSLLKQEKAITCSLTQQETVAPIGNPGVPLGAYFERYSPGIGYIPTAMLRHMYPDDGLEVYSD
jgi:hypothetical protein